MYRILLLLALLSAPAYADTRISQMIDGGATQANDSVPATRAGGSVKVELNTAASKAASSATSPTVSSVAGPTTAGHVATFSDTSGTVQDGGTLNASAIGGLAPVATTGAYSSLTGAPASLPPIGAAGGDLSGSFPNPTVGKINGQPPAPSATIDTTNAANISTGTLAGARLPVPTATILGGIKALAAAAHQFLTGVDTAGNPTYAQPAASDVSGLAPSATVNATNASNITTGTLPAAQLPTPTAAAIGGVMALAPAAHQFLTGIGTTGAPSATQPAASDITGLAPVATSNNYNDLSNKPTGLPPSGAASGDLSGSFPGPTVAKINGLLPAASATTDATNAANIASGTLAAARLPALTGDVTTPAGSAATTIAPGSVTASKLAPGAATSNVGTLGGDLSGTLASPTVAKINGLTPAAVATSGSYADLSNKPSIPTTLPPSGTATGDLSGSYPNPSVVRINGTTPATVATSGNYGDLLNLPTLGTAAQHAATDFLTPSSTVAATGASIARVLADHFADHMNVKDYGVVGGGTQLTDVVTSASSPVISSVTYSFTQADVGKTVYLTSQSTENALLASAATISSVQTYTGIQSAVTYGPGSGYATGDTITLAGGGVLTVSSVNGGQVTGVTITSAGNYATAPASPVAQASTSGSGTGATFQLNFTTATLNKTPTSAKTAPNYARLTMYKVDDTAAINNAITMLSAAGGGILDIPRGVYAATNIIARRNVILRGEGRQDTILFQIGGSNTNFVTSENFAALTGTGLNYGPSGTFNGITSDPRVPSWFGLIDLHIDGNRAYQTAGDCVDFYGNAQVWHRTFVEDCYGNGQWTEASSAFSYSSTDWRAQEEGFLDDMVVRDVGLDGWVDAGPHDSQVTSYVSYSHGMQGATACQAQSSGDCYGFDQKTVNGALGGSHFGTIHPYTSASDKTDAYIGPSNDIALLYSDFGSTKIAGSGNRISSVFLLSCGSDSTSPTCLDIAGASNNLGQVYGTWYFGTLATGQTMVKIESGANTGGNTIGMFQASSIASTVANNTLLSVQGSFNTVTANLDNASGTGDVCANAGGTYNKLSLTGYGCTTFLNYTGGGHNSFNLGYYVGTGQTAVSGSFLPTDTVTKTDSNAADYVNVEAGAAAQPALTFGGDLTTGLYHAATGKLDISNAGAQTAEWGATGLSVKAGNISFGSNLYNAPFDYEGTTSPAAFLLNTNTSQGVGEGFVLASDPGAAATSGARIGYIGFRDAIDSNHDLYQGAAISAYTAQAWSSTQGGSSINIETTHQGATSRTTDLTVTNGTVIVPAFTAMGVLSNTAGGILQTNPSVNIAGGAIQLGIAGTSLGEVTLNGNTSGTVNILPAAAAGSWSLVLPTTAGTSGQFLQTNGSGVATWATAGSGTVNSGTAGQLGTYSGTGTAISGSASATLSGGALTLGAANATAGSVVLEGSTSGAVTINTPAAAGTTTFTLPASNGTSGQVLQTNGSGVTSWATPASGSSISTCPSGTWCGSGPRNSVNGTYPTAGLLVAAPYQLNGTFTKVGMEVNAAGSGATAFLCVYDATGSGGSPGNLLASVPSASISAAGDFTGTLSSTVTVNGKVYLASEFSWSSSAPTMYLVGSIAPEMTLMPQTSVYGLTSGAAGNAGYSLTNTYSNGCPATFGSTTKVSSGSVPIFAAQAQ